MSPLLIDNPEALAEFVREAAGATWIAVDTEFMRERTYYPRLCLIQIATDAKAACIDPLAIEDLTPLFELLYDTRILKVFHAAGQDLEVLHHLTGRVPTPLFDTQIAAALSGHGDQCGYGRLVQTLLGVELAKGHTRADWAKRPLSDEELRYAADDVIYLRDVYRALHEDLEQRGRLAWLEDDFASLADPARYAPDPDQAWRRVKGWMQLKPAQQQILLRVARWRERMAMDRDRPRRWILKDDVVIDLARRKPRTLSDLARIRGMPPATVEHHGEALLTLVDEGLKAPAEPLAPRTQRLTPEQEPTVDVLMAALRAEAARHDVSAGALGSRRDLERLVQGERELDLLSGWRGRIAGRALVDVLEGRTRLGVADGRVTLVTAG